jgi:methylmalonyl-CoA mutase, C-terminal domain
MQLLEERGVRDVMVLIGGIIPAVDIPHLKRLGIKGLFPPGTPIQQIVDFIHANVRQVTEGAAQ